MKYTIKVLGRGKSRVIRDNTATMLDNTQAIDKVTDFVESELAKPLVKEVRIRKGE